MTGEVLRHLDGIGASRLTYYSVGKKSIFTVLYSLDDEKVLQVTTEGFSIDATVVKESAKLLRPLRLVSPRASTISQFIE